jgi:hypothetical protein
MPPPELTPYATPGFAVASVPGATIIPLKFRAARLPAGRPRRHPAMIRV